MSLLAIVLVVAAVIFLTVYLNGLYNEKYWTKRGVKFYNKHKSFGPIGEFLIGDRPLFEIFQDIYNENPDEPAIGVGTLFSPTLYVKDVHNVQYVAQSPNFVDRAVDYHKDDQLADNILFMSGERWKLMRQKMSPLFTSAKLKNMFYIIDKSSRDFVEYLNQDPEKLRTKTFHHLTTFCCAAMGNAVFGVGSESTFDSPFLDLTRQAFAPSIWNNIKFFILTISPKVFKLLRLKFFKEFEAFFIGAMKQVFRQREKEGVKKNDFIDICLSIQKSGAIKNDDTGYEMQPTDGLLAAQGFFFYTAGVEPTATAIFATMIQLGQHREIQKRVHEEVDMIFEKYNGHLNYDAVNEMEYLDKVVNEAIRIYPPVGMLTKRCMEDTILPIGNIKIDKGTRVFTPIYEYHRDPKIFEDPEEFDPERFSDPQKNWGVAYQPFGYGLRICIGMRYARLQVKSCLANILQKFILKTVIGEGGIKYRKDQILLRIENVNVEYAPREGK